MVTQGQSTETNRSIRNVSTTKNALNLLDKAHVKGRYLAESWHIETSRFREKLRRNVGRYKNNIPGNTRECCGIPDAESIF